MNVLVLVLVRQRVIEKAQSRAEQSRAEQSSHAGACVMG